MDIGQGRPFRLDAAWAATLCVGVVAQLQAPVLLPSAAAVATLPVALLLVWMRGPRLAVLTSALLLGAGLCALHGHQALSRRLPSSLDGASAVIEARVVGLPESLAQGSRFVAQVEHVIAGPATLAERLQGRRLALRWHGGGRALRPGERWRWSVRLGALRGAMNPGGGDPARRAVVTGVVGEGRVVTAARPLRIGAAGGLDAWRDAVSRQIAVALGDGRSRFVAALAVGDTRGLSDGDWDGLRQFGLTHLIAISGFHVGLVAGLGIVIVRVLWWLQPRLGLRWRRPQAAACAAFVVAVAYAGIAGFSLPTVRTVLMVGVVAWRVMQRTSASPWQGLVVAVALIAVVDPLALLTPGFWLSCGGVAWLIWCLPGGVSPWDGAAFLRAQWVASVGLLPLAAAFFLQVPVAGPLANLVAIPWISLVVVPLALLGTLLSVLSAPLAEATWALASGAMGLLWSLLDLVPARISVSHWMPTPPLWAVPLAIIGVLIALLPRGLPWRHAGWCLVLPLLFPPAPVPTEGRVGVTVFALPRGDALLLQTARHVVLVDAGPAHASLVPALRSLGVDAIDLRIATRGNAGRQGGAAAIDAVFPPAAVWTAPGAPGASPCEVGRRWSADGVSIEAVSPAPWAASGNSPDGSCVLVVRDQGSEYWLASEAGPWVARRLSAAASAEVEAVFAAPAFLQAWQAATGAGQAIATRAPGPSLAMRWPETLRRVDVDGALQVRAVEADPALRLVVWRDTRPRWWDGPPP